MAVNLKNFDSTGGFSVGRTQIVDELQNFENINTLKVQNSNFTNSSTTKYILSGLNTGVLSLDGSSEQIILPNNTINFITGTIAASNETGGGFYLVKIEASVSVNSIGDVSSLGQLTTVIRDTIPTGQEWDITVFDTGADNRFSFNTTRTGTTNTIKWVASTEVVSIDWS